jgi:excinuclease UvrABC ATPase subunit
MPHASNVVLCDGPDAPHAFDIVPLQPRNGSLDAACPVCHGHGQWNVELDLVSFRCKRAICPRCRGAGWVETGSDPVEVPDIELSADGHPQWITRQVPGEDVADADRSDAPLIPPSS